jgi:hypothetical protein
VEDKPYAQSPEAGSRLRGQGAYDE